jgi:ATP-dependent Clp protease ATP-binding subunit ClpA
MISKSLEASLGMALREARTRRHEYFCVEHLLYALLHDAIGKEIVSECGGSPDNLIRAIEQYFTREVERAPEGTNHVPKQTLAFERVMQRAISHVHFSGKKEVDVGDILAAMFEEKDSHAAYFLRNEGLSRLDVLNYISHGVSKEEAEAEIQEAEEQEHEEEKQKRRPKSDPLGTYAVNLTQRAKDGKIDPLIGRHFEMRRTVQTLCRRRKNNPIYVGEPGVGKTAMVEGLALRINEGKVPEMLKDSEVLMLDLAGMLAGTKFRGEFEQRLKSVMRAIMKRKNVILFIDEIHNVVGAGATTDSTVDASNILKPALSSGELRCIGATTFEEYKNHFEKDRAFSRRFQKIEIGEPTVDEAVQILRGLKKCYEEHHGITYTDSALKAAVELSAKHIHDRYLPDKAIDVIDEAGASLKLLDSGMKKNTIRPADIERVVAEIAKIPVRSVSSSDKVKLAAIDEELLKVVYGQDDAIKTVSKAIKRSRAGLAHPDKPVGSFLFTGPTGVGKTEVARQLARIMGVHFARYDMSEYMEKHTVARLIGAPPGYVGFDQGGLLTDEIRKFPHCVLLLDEIEKAHPDVFNILLQVMDHSTLTDNAGRKADFHNVVLIMTSNAGARELASNTLGFVTSKDDSQSKGLKAIERMFSPEFRNRLDAIVHFNSLSQELMGRIVDKFIVELQASLAAKKVSLVLGEDARAWLALKGYDPKFGARPLSRLIQVELKDRLSEELLFGKLTKGGAVYVRADGDALTFDIT